MASIKPNRLSAEIAHVLFLDLVGYSRLSMEEQSRLAKKLFERMCDTPKLGRAVLT